MRRIAFILISLIAISINGNAQSKQDSCYIYARINVGSSIKGFECIIQTGNQLMANRVRDTEGKTLHFENFINAMNYYSYNGWEVISISIPRNNNEMDNYAIIRKKIPKEEALKFSEPKKNKE